MKNKFLKLISTIVFAVSITACDFQNITIDKVNNISGIWENNLQNNDGTSVLTTLELNNFKKVNEKYNNSSYYTFSANLKSKLTGEPSEKVQLTTTNINLSGELRENTAVITDVQSDNESITTNSQFILSKDEMYLTLLPGEVKFKKKK